MRERTVEGEGEKKEGRKEIDGGGREEGKEDREEGGWRRNDNGNTDTEIVKEGRYKEKRRRMRK